MFQKRNTTFAPLITISVLRWNVPAAQVAVGTLFLFFSFHLVGTSKSIIFASEIDWKHRIFAFLLLVCCSKFFCCSKIIYYDVVFQSVMNGKCFAYYILHREISDWFSSCERTATNSLTSNTGLWAITANTEYHWKWLRCNDYKQHRRAKALLYFTYLIKLLPFSTSPDR